MEQKSAGLGCPRETEDKCDGIMKTENPYQTPTGEPADDCCPVEMPFVFYWSASSIPELASLPNEQRGKLWRKHFWGAYRHWETWLALLVCCGVFPGLSYFLIRLYDPNQTRSLALFGLFSGLGAVVFSQTLIFKARPYLRRALLSNDGE